MEVMERKAEVAMVPGFLVVEERTSSGTTSGAGRSGLGGEVSGEWRDVRRGEALTSLVYIGACGSRKDQVNMTKANDLSPQSPLTRACCNNVPT